MDLRDRSQLTGVPQLHLEAMVAMTTIVQQVSGHHEGVTFLDTLRLLVRELSVAILANPWHFLFLLPLFLSPSLFPFYSYVFFFLLFISLKATALRLPHNAAPFYVQLDGSSLKAVEECE